MAWLKKKPDPISERARALNAEIAALESEIRRLDAQLQRDPALPRLRSTAVPHGQTIAHPETIRASAPPASSPDPVFEELPAGRLPASEEAAGTRDHYNELGVRKFDLPATLRRWRQAIRGPTTTNPKLVSYLAAGGVHGLRPLRKEKRVARNRFIAFAIFLFLMLLGIIYMFLNNR